MKKGRAIPAKGSLVGGPRHVYRAVPFILFQRPVAERSLDETDPTNEVLRIIGLTELVKTPDLPIVEWYRSLEVSGKLDAMLRLVVEIEHGPSRNIKRAVTGMTLVQKAEAFQDFFSLNFPPLTSKTTVKSNG